MIGVLNADATAEEMSFLEGGYLNTTGGIDRQNYPGKRKSNLFFLFKHEKYSYLIHQNLNFFATAIPQAEVILSVAGGPSHSGWA